MRRALVAAALLAGALPAAAQDPAPAVRFPQFNTEIDMSMIGVGTTRSSDPAQRGLSVFLFGEIASRNRGSSHAILGRLRDTGGF